jgi:hypothetical protein
MNMRSLGPAATAILAVLLLTPTCWAADKPMVPQPHDPCTEACDAQPGCYDAECGSCAGPCGPRLQFFGDFLYLRPRNTGLEYAVPVNLLTPTRVPIQVGRTAALNPQFESGFRVGGGMEFDCNSTISATFTHYENGANDAIANDNPSFTLHSMVMHPSSADAAGEWNDANAHQFIRFNLVDVDYRHVFYCNERANANYLVGFRYASLQQEFNAQFNEFITGDVDTNINFDGGGIRLGLEGERAANCCNLFLYGKTAVSFLGGEFQGSYLQGDTNNPLIAQTDWREARLVSILDLEVGLGWTSCTGRVRASAGYMVSGWLNVVKTPEFISAVQANAYHGPDKIDGNALVFDGWVSRVELRW